MAFFFPLFYKYINWSKELFFLDQELQQIFSDSVEGVGYLDKLVQVHRLNREVRELFVHIEIQNQRGLQFSKRIIVLAKTKKNERRNA